MAAPHVPVELVEEILSKVPVKSLLRFKTASKKWYSLLSQDHNFSKFHMNQSKNPLLFFQVSPRGTTFQSFNIDTNESRIFNFPFEVDGGVELIGAANGLICVAYYLRLDFFLWNPCTGECEKISMGMANSRSKGIGVYGFGYDSHSGDYKVVSNWGMKIFHIFSLKKNSWKAIDNGLRKMTNAFQFNGALHWCLFKNIYCFDLVEEKIFFMELPDEIKPTIDQYCFSVVSFWEYQGCLCLSGGKSIWMMKKYKDGRSWVKLNQCLVENKIPLGISKLGEVVYRAKDGYGFVRSDIQGGMSNDDKLQILNGVGLSPSAFVYTESLISPKCFEQSEEERSRIIAQLILRKQRKLMMLRRN